MVSAQTEEALEAEKFLRNLIAKNKAENVVDEKQIRNKQSSTFKSVSRSERFQEKKAECDAITDTLYSHGMN